MPDARKFGGLEDYQSLRHPLKASITHGALVPRTEDHVTTCLTLSMVCTPYYPHSTPYGIIEGLISSILCHDADVQL